MSYFASNSPDFSVEHNSILEPPEHAMSTDLVHINNATLMTESEMSTLLDRMSSNWFALSRQAAQLSTALKDIESLKAEVTGLKNNNTLQQMEIEDLQAQVTALKSELEETVTLANTYAKERDEYKVKVDLQQIEINDLQAQLKRARDDADSWSVHANKSDADLVAAHANVQKATEERDAASRKAEHLTEQNARQESTIRAQVESMGVLQTNLAVARQDVDAAQKAKVEMQNEVERLKEQLTEYVVDLDNALAKLDQVANIVRPRLSVAA